jgi:hypothetical protein
MAAKTSVKRRDPAAELAETLVESLRAKKLRGDYPVSLRQLVEAVAPPADPAFLAAAVGKSHFTKAAFLVKSPDKKKGVTIQHVMESPVGLWEDAKLVAAHPFTLAFVRSANPDGTPAKLKKWVNGAGKGAFKKPFSEALDEQAPRALLKVLENLRALGEPSYPVTLRRLAELTDRMPLPDAANAVAKTIFLKAVVFAAKLPTKVSAATATKLVDTPLALRDDIKRLAGSATLLEYGLRKCKTATDCGFHIEEIAIKVFGTVKGSSEPELRSQFVQLSEKNIVSGSTPRTIGWVTKKSKPLLFLMEDLQPAGVRASHAIEADRKRPASEAPAEAATARPRNSTAPLAIATASPITVDDRFEGRFDSEFSRLDRVRGSFNFVPLLDLRRALPEFPREQFDRGLKLLRQARRYRINVGEGRSGVTPEQQEAAIIEDGTIHSSVSRVK